MSSYSVAQTTNGQAVNSKKRKPLLRYEFCGGRYPILILAAIAVFGISIALFALVRNEISENLGAAVGMIILASLLGLLMIFCIIAVIFGFYKYLQYRNTYFEIYDDKVSGVCLVRGAKGMQGEFELSFSQISAVAVYNGFIAFYSQTNGFETLIASKEFSDKLMNTLKQFIPAEKFIFTKEEAAKMDEQQLNSQNTTPNAGYIPVTNTDSEHMTVGAWFGRMCIQFIPVVGGLIYIIMLFVWAFGSTPKKSLKTYAKAQLLFVAIAVAAIILIVAIISAVGVSILNAF